MVLMQEVLVLLPRRCAMGGFMLIRFEMPSQVRTYFFPVYIENFKSATGRGKAPCKM